MTTPPNWHSADRAYQLHHAICAICRAAGARPGMSERCQQGQALWDAYNRAGLPAFLKG